MHVSESSVMPAGDMVQMPRNQADIPDRDRPTCIYCGSPGPFTDEHVVPASIGGDDRDWLLKGCVCANCNTRIFSPLETKFAKSSMLTIPRMAFQPTTRKRGTKTEPPRGQPKDSLFADPNQRLVAEATFVGGAGLTPVYMPQIHLVRIDNESVESRPLGPDPESMSRLLSDLASMLNDEIVIIEKRKGEATPVFSIHTMRWEADQYHPTAQHDAMKPPERGFWFASLDPVRLLATGEIMLTPRVFRHPSGSITCRAASPASAALVLGILRSSVPRHSVRGDEPKQTALPLIKQTYTLDLTAFLRVLAKIGLNLIAHTSGLEVVRAPNFDGARQFVLTSSTPPAMKLVSNDRFSEGLEAHASERHLVCIKVTKLFRRQRVSVLLRLYGGPVHEVILTTASRVSTSVRPVSISVDYVNHKIYRH